MNGQKLWLTQENGTYSIQVINGISATKIDNTKQKVIGFSTAGLKQNNSVNNIQSLNQVFAIDVKQLEQTVNGNTIRFIQNGGSGNLQSGNFQSNKSSTKNNSQSIIAKQIYFTQLNGDHNLQAANAFIGTPDGFSGITQKVSIDKVYYKPSGNSSNQQVLVYIKLK
jgi:hypothetical protein